MSSLARLFNRNVMLISKKLFNSQNVTVPYTPKPFLYHHTKTKKLYDVNHTSVIASNPQHAKMENEMFALTVPEAVTRKYKKRTVSKKERQNGELSIVASRRRFTSEEDKLILLRGETFGDSKETWQNLAEELELATYPSWVYFVSTRFRILTKNLQGKKRKFTPQEDKEILEYIDTHGLSNESCKALCKKLNRNYEHVIKQRLEYLNSKPLTPAGKWSLSDDKTLLEAAFQVYF